MKKIKIYTDGSAKPNPGKGGLGVVIKFEDDNEIVELKESYCHTTNNRMEILAVIRALEYFSEPQNIHVFSDSRYVVNAINSRWIINWKKSHWIKSDGDKVKNIDLWVQLDELISEHKFEISWIRGHAGNQYNERADELANEAIQLIEPIEDIGYQKAIKSTIISNLTI